MLKLDGLIQGSALLAARAVHIRIVGVDIPAFDAAEDTVVTGRGSEPTLALFGVDRQRADPGQQQHDVSKQDGVRRHGWAGAGIESRRSGRLANGRVCHWKISLPQVSASGSPPPR